VGYGFGWILQAGSIQRVGSYYVFTDGSGAEYRLDQNTNNLWTSREGTYVTFDANTSMLYFPDGSSWVMNVQSASGEADAGTLYPSRLQDSNGNYIDIQYQTGIGASAPNTSARITQILDARYTYPYYSYSFTYNSDPIPHLTAISNTLLTSENYTFSYSTNQPLISPFNSASFGTAALLQAVTISGLNISHNFQYQSGSCELTQLTTPFGGMLSWQYGTFTYSGYTGGRSYREVRTRQMRAVTGGTLYTWNLTFDTANPKWHAWAILADVGAGTQKQWWAGIDISPLGGLATKYEERDGAGAVLLRKEYGWTQDAAGNIYLNAVVNTLNPGTASAAQSKTLQILDTYGNLTQSQVYDYGNLTTPVRTYDYQYLNGANYISRYIRNRMTSASVTSASGTLNLVTNTYDNYAAPNQMQVRTGTRMHNDAFDANVTYRGNPTTVSTQKGTTTYVYETTGVVAKMTDASGVTVTTNPSPSSGYSLPGRPDAERQLQSGYYNFLRYVLRGDLSLRAEWSYQHDQL
jgi:hypothetical protein